MMLKRLALSCTALLIAIGGLQALHMGAQADAQDLLQQGLRQGQSLIIAERQAPRVTVIKRSDGVTVRYRDLDAEEKARLSAEKGIEALRFGPEGMGRLKVMHALSKPLPAAGALLVAHAPVQGEWGWTLRAELPADAMHAGSTGLWPTLLRQWPAALLLVSTVLGLLWLAARLRDSITLVRTREAAPLWATTITGASPESIAKLEALARDNEHLKQELLASGEQLKQVTESVKQRREAGQPRPSRSPA